MSTTIEVETVVPDLGREKVRVGWIDGARGLAIAAMIVSHVGSVSGVSPWWFHLYVMRPFAPVFLVLLGMLWRPGWRRRHWQLLGAAAIAEGLGEVLGLGAPGILTLMVAVVLVLPWAIRWPSVTIALCVTQLAYWGTPEWWTGYPPGFVVALALIGALARSDGAVEAFGRLGSRLGLEVVGRRPMTWYLGHLFVLGLLVEV